MLEDIILPKELRQPARESYSRSRTLIMITCLELGSNPDRMFSRYLMGEFLKELVNLPGTIHLVLLSQAVMMVMDNSPYTAQILRLAERGEILVHKSSWRHYFPDSEPFVGKLCEMSEIVAKIATVDKVIYLR